MKINPVVLTLSYPLPLSSQSTVLLLSPPPISKIVLTCAHIHIHVPQMQGSPRDRPLYPTECELQALLQ